jgi:hypothetical protein
MAGLVKQPNRQVAWKNRRRAWMMKVLGGRCLWCGTRENLTFDCIVATGDAHHRMSSVQRMCYYNRQFRLGNLQVLCHYCNSAKAARDQERYRPCNPAELSL